MNLLYINKTVDFNEESKNAVFLLLLVAHQLIKQ